VKGEYLTRGEREGKAQARRRVYLSDVRKRKVVEREAGGKGHSCSPHGGLCEGLARIFLPRNERAGTEPRQFPGFLSGLGKVSRQTGSTTAPCPFLRIRRTLLIDDLFFQ